MIIRCPKCSRLISALIVGQMQSEGGPLRGSHVATMSCPLCLALLGTQMFQPTEKRSCKRDVVDRMSSRRALNASSRDIHDRAGRS